MAKENKPEPNALAHKCQGNGCAYKHSCGRFLRDDAADQLWAAYYALNDDDCDAFEAVVTEKGKV